MKRRSAKKPTVMGVFATLERAQDRQDPSRVVARQESAQAASVAAGEALRDELLAVFGGSKDPWSRSLVAALKAVRS